MPDEMDTRVSEDAAKLEKSCSGDGLHVEDVLQEIQQNLASSNIAADKYYGQLKSELEGRGVLPKLALAYAQQEFGNLSGADKIISGDEMILASRYAKKSGNQVEGWLLNQLASDSARLKGLYEDRDDAVGGISSMDLERAVAVSAKKEQAWEVARVLKDVGAVQDMSRMDGYISREDLGSTLQRYGERIADCESPKRREELVREQKALSWLYANFNDVLSHEKGRYRPGITAHGFRKFCHSVGLSDNEIGLRLGYEEQQKKLASERAAEPKKQAEAAGKETVPPAKESPAPVKDAAPVENRTKSPGTKDGGVAEKPKAEEPVKAVEKPKAAEPAKAVEKPKAAEPAKAVEKPKAEEPAKAVEKPKAEEPAKAVEKPKAEEPAKAVEKPKADVIPDAGKADLPKPEAWPEPKELPTPIVDAPAAETKVEDRQKAGAIEEPFNRYGDIEETVQPAPAPTEEQVTVPDARPRRREPIAEVVPIAEVKLEKPDVRAEVTIEQLEKQELIKALRELGTEVRALHQRIDELERRTSQYRVDDMNARPVPRYERCAPPAPPVYREIERRSYDVPSCGQEESEVPCGRPQRRGKLSSFLKHMRVSARLPF